MDLKVEIERRGFGYLRGILQQDELKGYTGLVDEIVVYGEVNHEDPFTDYFMRHRTDQGTIYDLFQRHPEFQDLAKHPKILEALERIIGPNIFLYENSLVYKPQGRPNEVPWHQDIMNRPVEPIKYIAWIALDDINPGNGSLRVIPGSHKMGFLPYVNIPGETHHTRLDPSSIPDQEVEAVEMKVGDVLIFHQLLVHSSERINDPQPRRAYRVSYQGFDQIFTPRGSNCSSRWQTQVAGE